MEFLESLEQTLLSVWLRESPSMFVFPGMLVLHAIGMGFLAGTNAAIGLRILGFAPAVPLSLMEKFYPVMWFGLVINVISGVLLLIAYPTKAVTNPVFYIKLGFIAAGLIAAWRIRQTMVRNPAAEFGPAPAGRALAAVSLAVWAGAIVAGRLLAYTCNYLMAGRAC